MFSSRNLAVLSALSTLSSATLQVIEPETLKTAFYSNDYQIPSKLGNFGLIQSGASFMGTVIFPQG
jgi:hypothetical protein